MSEKMLEALERLSRRGFVAKLTGGAAAAVLAVIGTPKEAQAQDMACCRLCSTTCDSGMCAWSYTCCHEANQCVYTCIEYYDTIFSCDGSCNGLVGSCAYNTGIPCH
jgi:hypothetical protein